MRIVYSLLATLFFMPRLDYSIFGLFLERFDMGFMSYVSFLHMEVNQTHPVKLSFCEILKRSINDENIQSMSKEKKIVRNRWNLMYTLHKNPFLKRERKESVTEQSAYQYHRTETLKHFVLRKLGNPILALRKNLRKKDEDTIKIDVNEDKLNGVMHKKNPLKKKESLPLYQPQMEQDETSFALNYEQNNPNKIQ